MFANLLFSLSFFFLFAIPLFSGISFSVRLLTFLSFFTLLGLSYSFLFFQEKKPWLFSWLSSTLMKPKNGILSFLFILMAFFFWKNEISQGISVSYWNPQGILEKEIVIHVPNFEIQPSQFPFDISQQREGKISLRAYFHSTKEIHSLLFHTSYGNAIWKLDGQEISRFAMDSTTRFFLIQKELSPGIHRLDCELDPISPPPRVSISTGLQEPISAPFFQKSIFPYTFSVPFSSSIASLLFLLAFFFVIPAFNKTIKPIASLISRYPSIFLIFGIFSCLIIFFGIRDQFSWNTDRYYEADEAAFGLMSELLLDGQSPPLFHYGQPYQGTLESLPLALSIKWGGFSGKGLHFLPFLWGFFFIILTTLTFWCFGSRGLALTALFLFSVGGLHFHWIISKTWFGYSFSLFCGSILWLITFRAVNQKKLSPGWAVLWGVVAGLSLYELPISLPFILCTFLLLTTLFFQHLFPFPSPFTFHDFFYKKMFPALFHSGIFLSVFTLFLSTFPYWIDPFLNDNSGAIHFLTHGRNLPTPRISGESALMDRVLKECFPVLLGVRSPFDHQNDVSSAIFPAFPLFLFLSALFIFPFVSSRHFSNFLFASSSVRIAIFLFTLFSIFAVTFSPFGIWPWYLIPLYWAIPIFIFIIYQFFWKISPSLTILLFSFHCISLFSPLQSYNALYHEPSSLSYQGLWVPTQFEKVKQLLKQQQIRYLICDQGFDTFSENTGRDWIGECLSFDSNRTLISFDRLSRRLPSYAQEVTLSSRVGYLFHKNYVFMNATIPTDQPVSIDTLSSLFGPSSLNFDSYDCDPYVLFLPKKYTADFDKKSWVLSASNPIFLRSSIDNNISPREYGSSAYWSSDTIPAEGCQFSISFPKPKLFSKVILYHGTKVSDKTHKNRVFIRTEKDTFFETQPFQYDSTTHCSYLRLNQKVEAKEIKIIVYPDEEKNWWTIFELWVF